MNRVVAILVHAFTAMGGVLAFAALLALAERDLRRTWLVLCGAVMIDYVDGALARRLKISERLPVVDGEKLDCIVDFAVNALVPAVLLCATCTLPEPTIFWVATMLGVAAYRHSLHPAPSKARGFFSGMPIFWIFIAFYAVFLPLPHVAVGILLVLAAALTFTSLRFIHVARFPKLRALNAAALGAWWICYLAVTQEVCRNARLWVLISIAYPTYYLLSSAWLLRDMVSARPPSDSLHGC